MIYKLLHRRAARLVALGVGLLAVLGLAVVGSASAHTTRNVGVSTGTTKAVNGAQESATFAVYDDGSSIVIVGRARNMKREVSYLSLSYPDSACSQTQTPTTLTLAGKWVANGDGTQDLYARYDGKAARDVRGHIGSQSIRRIDFAANTPGAATLTPLACATLTPTGR